MKKTLYILRHAKTEIASSGQDDHDRRLILRGVDAAGSMAKYMAKRGMKPEKILCSTAMRTKQTVSVMELAPVEYVEKLYLASANEILGLLAKTPETVNSLMVIGHNPGLHELSLKLAKKGDDQLLNKLNMKFPTCALATINFSGTWHDIARESGELADFMTPKMLEAKG